MTSIQDFTVREVLALARSLLESVSELHVAKKQRYLKTDAFEESYQKAENLAKMLSGFRRNLKRRF